nr:uncharacterized protein LOC112026028 [Quercus suber]
MYCRNGKYAVKSGYHVARMLAKDSNGREESSEQRANYRVWTQLWKLQELEAFLIQCWLIWHHQNSLLHGGTMQHPGQLNKRATDFLKEYRDAQSSLATGLVSPVIMQNWKPPPGQLSKLNFDAATFANGLGVGAVTHNVAGDVMVALSARGAVVVDSEEAEALACRKAMEFTIDARFSELIVEGDNAMVMSAVSSTSPNWSCLGVIYDDIGCVVARLLYVAFSCIRHSANSVAHSLARYANVLDEEVVWLEDSPPPARDALYFNSSFLNE